MVGIKEGTYYMEHWVLYINNESWNTASKTNDDSISGNKLRVAGGEGGRRDGVAG